MYHINTKYKDQLCSVTCTSMPETAEHWVRLLTEEFGGDFWIDRKPAGRYMAFVAPRQHGVYRRHLLHHYSPAALTQPSLVVIEGGRSCT